jgi:hypothetical protein
MQVMFLLSLKTEIQNEQSDALTFLFEQGVKICKWCFYFLLKQTLKLSKWVQSSYKFRTSRIKREPIDSELNNTGKVPVTVIAFFHRTHFTVPPVPRAIFQNDRLQY